MPRVDFYILPDQSPQGRELLACRLTEKAYRLGHKVYIHAASIEQARLLDDLLWSFRQGSFIPHALYPAESDGLLTPVLIGWQENAKAIAQWLDADTLGVTRKPSAETMLINLSPEVPPTFARFERVAEVVDQNPQVLEKSRQRFRYYRDRGFPPESYKL